VALAEGSRGRLTALYIVGRSSQRHPAWGTRIADALAPASTARAVIRDIEELGRSYGVAVNGIARSGERAAELILREIEAGHYDLTVLGVSPRPGEQLFFGDIAATLLRDAPASLVFLASEPAAASDQGVPQEHSA
jgi:nucleotide-binding universal stress UspA family protein